MYRYQAQTFRPSIITYLLDRELIPLRFVVSLIYLVWFVFGLFGVHNLLLARYGLALFQVIIALLGIAIFPWGIPLLILAGILVLIDGFVIGAMVRYQYECLQKEKTGPRIINQ